MSRPIRNTTPPTAKIRPIAYEKMTPVGLIRPPRSAPRSARSPGAPGPASRSSVLGDADEVRHQEHVGHALEREDPRPERRLGGVGALADRLRPALGGGPVERELDRVGVRGRSRGSLPSRLSLSSRARESLDRVMSRPLVFRPHGPMGPHRALSRPRLKGSDMAAPIDFTSRAQAVAKTTPPASPRTLRLVSRQRQVPRGPRLRRGAHVPARRVRGLQRHGGTAPPPDRSERVGCRGAHHRVRSPRPPRDAPARARAGARVGGALLRAALVLLLRRPPGAARSRGRVAGRRAHVVATSRRPRRRRWAA